MNFKLFTLLVASFVILSLLQCSSTKTRETNKKRVKKRVNREQYIVKDSVVTDIDGNSYNSVVINNIEWMTSNLRVTHYNDGTPIIFAPTNKDWSNRQRDSYCWVNNDSTLRSTYGAYYNYGVVTTEKLCPDGWHIATKEEWGDSLMFYIRDMLKDSITETNLRSKTEWVYYNLKGNDKYKLNLLPSGYRDEKGRVDDFGTATGFWMGTEEGHCFSAVFNTGGGMGIRSLDYYYGLPVRCVRNRKKSEVQK